MKLNQMKLKQMKLKQMKQPRSPVMGMQNLTYITWGSFLNKLRSIFQQPKIFFE